MTAQRNKRLDQIKSILNIDEEQAKKDLVEYQHNVVELTKEHPLTPEEQEYVNYNIQIQEKLVEFDKENPQSSYILDYLYQTLGEKATHKVLNFLTSDETKQFEQAVTTALHNHAEIIMNLIDTSMDFEEPNKPRLH